ncbi:hypothetical protein [Nonomuraea typhae]|uniref:hypothetical protein n=1 Tax=Nonomuraea typhae TaxID=2603600 RepID=UPI0012F8AC9F|nr:hypothetical protein [Nonomuraea typhae]
MTNWLDKLRIGGSRHSGTASSGSSSANTDVAKILQEARKFGEYVQQALNSTICDYLKISAVVHPKQHGVVIVARGISKANLLTEAFPLRTMPDSQTRAWMDLSFRFCFDPEGEYFTVLSAFVAIYADAEGVDRLCHFDYERDKADGYPEAHIQVYGDSPVLRKWGGRLLERGLDRLHFPAGHRRFRWCLEDVIEFVIAEKIVHPKPGWRDVIEPGRKKFHQRQLRAAIRRDMETTIRYLESEGYTVTPPPAK